MAYLAIAYPELNQIDYEWIQEYRKKNDKLYFDVVQPHITLVFAISDILIDGFINECTGKLKEAKAFNFISKVATINLDESGNYYHEFLVIDDGCSRVIKLHDKLYSGLFAKHLRHDIDYIPHIGIGNSNNVNESKKRVDDLNKQDFTVKAKVSSVDIVEYKNNVITTLQKLPLCL